MPRTPQDVTDAELAVLHEMWERGSATVRELAEALYPPGGASQLATIKKLLERLEAKGCVAVQKDLWPHVFRPTLTRQELIGRQLQTTADKLCEGSLQPLLSHLVRAQQLSAAERQSLRDLLDELDQESKVKKKK